MDPECVGSWPGLTSGPGPDPDPQLQPKSAGLRPGPGPDPSLAQIQPTWWRCMDKTFSEEEVKPLEEIFVKTAGRLYSCVPDPENPKHFLSLKL